MSKVFLSAFLRILEPGSSSVRLFASFLKTDDQKVLNETKVGQELVAKAQAAQAEGQTDLHPSDKDMTLKPEVVLAKAAGEELKEPRPIETRKSA